ncbi:MAG: hypothetical protein DU481_03645 [Nitrosomonas sp.]
MATGVTTFLITPQIVMVAMCQVLLLQFTTKAIYIVLLKLVKLLESQMMSGFTTQNKTNKVFQHHSDASPLHSAVCK